MAVEFIRLLSWEMDCADMEDTKGEKQLTGRIALCKCHKSNSNSYELSFTLPKAILILLLKI